MKRIKNSRRGATLTELVVVLAVIVIASAMVVSFSSLIGGHRNISDAKLEAMQDVRIAESTIEGFIEGHNNIELTTNKITGTDEGNQNTNSIYFKNKKLVYEKTGIVNENIEIGLENVNSITFDSLPGNDGDVIYFCTVTYEDPGHDEPAKYTFCVNPYAGETIGGN
nr:hypothetical protein [Oscillospiraceae bacterium]